MTNYLTAGDIEIINAALSEARMCECSSPRMATVSFDTVKVLKKALSRKNQKISDKTA